MATQNENGIKSFTAGEALAVWRRVKLTAGSGTQVEYADAEDKAIGITQAAAASGAQVAVRMLNCPGTFKATCAGAVSIGDHLYGAADGKVDDSTTASGEAVLIALEAATADGDIIETMPVLVGGSALLYANLADSAEVENTVTETAFDVSKTIKGAELQVGDVLEVLARAYVVDNNSTDTLELKLYVGTEVIVTTGAVDVADADIGYIHAFITVRATGASGSIAASGVVALGVPGTVTAKPFRKDAATEDISGDVEIAVKATWSVAHADNEVELENLIVIHHRQ